ncbi:hypothetical protein JM84_1453 [Dokdonia sp. Hel_I_63]|jgi:hypothetical protein|uniref:hypothetical protein n=1 Tax=unclassified Dokdonia TaxID=2615033 RepID=UPI00020A7885|nr:MULTISPECIES: hypothetical protein [unclassified Dokdonia]AEE18217.1 hypothetical protein Krodi_0229 [Dokdonia sp. 4H-3-7-5]TVZ22550.1 hypothetical protein JM84_1453 [Dokdonia sp. Hel_I_63]
MRKIRYKETQPFHLIVIICAISIALMTFFIIKQLINNDTIPYTLIACCLLFIVILILFYKLEIIITSRYAIASFGIGLLYKKIAINELDITTARGVKIPWYWGIGIRFTPEGTLYNTHTGGNLHIKTKNKMNEFFVSTSNASSIITALREAQNASNT